MDLQNESKDSGTHMSNHTIHDSKQNIEDYLKVSGVKNKKQLKKIVGGIESAILTAKAITDVSEYRNKKHPWQVFIAICFIAAASYACFELTRDRISSWLNPTTEINSFVDSFPGKLAGASSVTSYNPNGSNHVLIHIMQQHNEPFYDINSLSDNMRADQESLSNTRIVQRDIATIIKSLHDNADARAIYLEGLTEKDCGNNFESCVNQDEKKLQYVDLQFKNIESLQSQIHDTQAMWLEAEKRVLTNQKAYILNKLTKERVLLQLGFQIKYSEMNESHEVAGKMLYEFQQKHKSDTTSVASYIIMKIDEHMISPVLLERREDDLLQIVTVNKDRVAYTVYGGAHDWTNNVIKWNRSHSKERFSYIRITPTHYIGG